jgi:hypothetical protein
MALFSFAEEFAAVVVFSGDVFKACSYEFAGFLY